MYCSKCGAKNDDDAKYCIKCSTSLEKLQKTNEKNIENPKENIKPKASKSVLKSMGLIFAVLLIMCFALVITGAIYGTHTSNSHATSKDNYAQIYTKSPSDVVLNIKDMPHGWRSPGNTVIKDNTAEARFIFVRSESVDTVDCIVSKYSTINEAESKYQSVYNELSITTSLGHPNVGDEAYENSQQAGMPKLDNLVFRKGNFIVKISSVGVESIDFAKIVAGKIKN